MTLVKVCGITNLVDALAAVEAGADMLGFNFYARSPRHVEPDAAHTIIERVPEGVACVGVFVNESSPEEVLKIARESGVSAVQLHGDETPDFCRALEGFTTIKALRVKKDYTVETASAFDTDALLLDAYAPDAFGGTGHTFDWTLARATREAVPRLFLAGGLKPSNVADAIDAVGPYAVDVCSGVETSPGRKSFGLMRDFVAAVREAERMKAE
ncbi:MAG TPA: phosphoribosylanthranilate isomerase [Pyrinomonadaceae bacterium]|jgi:phosphoribosylanthranilate isomerase|nr:phosphoribosylanthranilate isomerase [Pyrinomonadaceae bacterium]